MNHEVSVLCLSIAILFLTVFAYEEDEYYCRQTKDYKICRRCSDLDKPCPIADWDKECTCNHIAVFDPSLVNAKGEKGNFKGGPACEEDEYGDSFCYINKETQCDDSDISPFASNNDKLWTENEDIHFSFEACENPPQRDVTGNQKFLENVKIEMDLLENAVTGKPLVIEFPIPSLDDYDYDYQETEIGWEKCEEQCTARNTNTTTCGAWSFDSLKGHCFLHNVDACCGQLDKQVKAEGFVSGYVCYHCWSTRNDCPCKLSSRQACESCSAFSAGGSAAKPIHTTSAAVLEVQTIKFNPDVCACKRKYLRRQRRWGCRKPLCDVTENGTGCKDKRRCRKPRKRQG